MKIKATLFLVTLLLALGGPNSARALNSAFTYRGHLVFNQTPANGPYDFQFTLWDALNNGNQVGAMQNLLGVSVNQGMFTAVLDFSAMPFDGKPLWLQISVKSAASVMPYQTLAPRQPIMSSPYAIFADKAAGLNMNAGSSTVPNLSADQLDGMDSSEFWKLAGNAGTTAMNFLGTTDYQPLELRVNNSRALRLEPRPVLQSPNIIGGYYQNYVQSGVSGATIGGGGSAGQTNIVNADFGTIDGGFRHRIDDYGATIGGGYYNMVVPGAKYATIPGGREAQARLWGQMAYANGKFATNGDAQTSVYMMRRRTTASMSMPADLFLDGLSARLTVPAGATLSFDALVVARATNGFSAGYHFRGVIENNQGTVAFAGVPLKSVLGENLAGWDADVVADNSANALAIRVEGASANYPNGVATDVPIQWVATVRTAEVSGSDGTFIDIPPPK